MSSVGTVLGAAQALQAQSAEAARELLGTGAEAGIAGDGRPVPREEPAAGVGYRAPFRWDGDVCYVIDQRRLPDVLVDLEVRGAVDAVNAIRDEAIAGAPGQAQLAAITLALIANRSVASRPFARRATIRGAGNALRNTRPASAVMVATIERMLAVLDVFGTAAEGEAIAAALQAEAEAIIREMLDAHGALVGHALRVLPGEPAAPLRVLTIGSTGPMGGGQLGTAGSVILTVHHSGRPIQALIAETRPGFLGSRIAAWEMREAGVDHAVVTDAAAPGCIAAGEVDLVIVGADRVAANGDVIAVAGTYPLALAAATARVPFIVCTSTAGIDLGLAAGDDAAVEQGPPGRTSLIDGRRLAPEGTRVRAPSQDLTPASLVSAIVTEQGAIGGAYEASLSAHVAAAQARREASPNPMLPPAPVASDSVTISEAGS